MNSSRQKNLRVLTFKGEKKNSHFVIPLTYTFNFLLSFVTSDSMLTDIIPSYFTRDVKKQLVKCNFKKKHIFMFPKDFRKQLQIH